MKIALLFLALCVAAHAATLTVTTCTAANAALTASQASGSVITMANGVYVDCSIVINCKLCRFAAQTQGGVSFTGKTLISLYGTGASISGFSFTSATYSSNTKKPANGNIVEVYGSSNTITKCTFNRIGYIGHYVVFESGSQYGHFAYNSILNAYGYCNANWGGTDYCATTGATSSLVQVVPNATVIGYHKIRYNLWSNLVGKGNGGDNGMEPMRLGDGEYSALTAGTLVEFNVFNNTYGGDSETISVKSKGNVIRYNTVVNNYNGYFCARNADGLYIYGNYVANSGLARVKQSNNVWVYNNYVEGTTDSKQINPFIMEYYSAGYTQNIHLVHNTFVNTPSIDLGASKAFDSSMSLTVANNVFYRAATSSPNAVSGAYQSTAPFFINQNMWTAGKLTFASNMYYSGDGSNALGLTGANAGFTNADPAFSRAASNGMLTLTANSPAKTGASTSFTLPTTVSSADSFGAWNNDASIGLDFYGNVRSGTKHIGHAQYGASAATVTGLSVTNAGPLSMAQVGASATGSLGFLEMDNSADDQFESMTADFLEEEM